MRYSDLITEDNDPNDPHLKYIASLIQTDDGGMYWIELQPDITGLKMTFWVSCDSDFPYFIVDPTRGGRLLPTKRCKAFHYWKTSAYPEVDAWMNSHKTIVQSLLDGKINGRDFYRSIRQSLKESTALLEMANVTPDLSGVNYTIYCSKKQHEADIRIKVIINKKNPNDSVTIATRANVVKGTGLSNSEINLIRKWIVLNHKALEDFWYGKIEKTEIFYETIESIEGKENDPNLNWDEYIENLKATENEQPKNSSKQKKKNSKT